MRTWKFIELLKKMKFDVCELEPFRGAESQKLSPELCQIAELCGVDLTIINSEETNTGVVFVVSFNRRTFEIHIEDCTGGGYDYAYHAITEVVEL